MAEFCSECFHPTMSEGSSDSAAPVVQLDANSLCALSDALAPMILDSVQRELPTSRPMAGEQAMAAPRQEEDDSVALYPDRDDLADSALVSENSSTSGSISR